LRSPGLEKVAQATGYTAQILVRRVRLLEFLENTAAKNGLDPDRLVGGNFTTLEVAQRLFERRGGDDHALHLLKQAGDPKSLIGVEYLRSELKEAVWSAANNTEESGEDSSDLGETSRWDRAQRSSGRHYRRREIARALNAAGYGPLRSEVPEWRTVAPDRIGNPICRFEWWRRRTEGFVGGFDVLFFPAGTLERAIDDRLARVFAASRYFREFNIVLVNGPNDQRVSDALAWLDDDHIGLLLIQDPVVGPPPEVKVGLAAEPGPETAATRLLDKAITAGVEAKKAVVAIRERDGER
jgi:hypothetical protein